ncbi:MFS transporter [Lichenibacterium minor]|uniref:MFS transporter n=1 Tax=Lichenibacterium minor TaxID=2316528 RepID=A0A4Q2UAU0_9HYPH|nr:MFS transporter [Lichenibacterium minor]RYC33692.1 MFS transporter [Lichenibacterium minor]
MLRPYDADTAADVAAPSLDAGSLPDAAGLAGGPAAPAAPDLPRNRVGSARYVRASLALFLAGFATFSLLYCPQPLLPTLSRAFAVDAAAASLSISVVTTFLALSIVGAATLSDRKGRRSVMLLSLLLASGLNAVAAFAPSWPLFLAARALEGVALGGVPAVAMTYLAEETEAGGLGLAMGIYVGATAVGGMGGRVITGLVAEHAGWRAAVATIGVLGLVDALGFVLLLPPSRHFRPRAVDLRTQARAFRAAVADRRLLLVYAFAFLAMGGFVAVYNYAGYRLEAPPYSLDQAQEGLIFTLYLLGTLSSTLAGTLADRIGRAPVMALGLGVALVGAAATVFAPLAAVVFGIALVTVGFFAGHGVASGTVGVFAGGDKAQAASLYLLSYYAGSSVLGTVGGVFWSAGGWPGVAGFVAALFAGAAALAGALHRRVRAQGRA